MKCVDAQQKEWYGQTSAGKMVFSAIHPQDSFSYTDYFTDEEGNINQEMPASNTTVRFVANDDGMTTLHTETSYPSEAALKQVLEMGMEEGYGQTLDKLDEMIQSL